MHLKWEMPRNVFCIALSVSDERASVSELCHCAWSMSELWSEKLLKNHFDVSSELS